MYAFMGEIYTHVKPRVRNVHAALVQRMKGHWSTANVEHTLVGRLRSQPLRATFLFWDFALIPVYRSEACTAEHRQINQVQTTQIWGWQKRQAVQP
jgi:hypothetical protein